MYEILDRINTSSDVKKVDPKDIPRLNEEIRDFLIKSVTETGGHLASNLGIVELTVALHRVFDLPKDRVIFDVGHQSYVHKILSERKDGFSTLRQENGLSGFSKRSESEYDAFGAGHSSTAISAALGFSEADRLCGRDNYTVAVVGDGAFTGGMVYEALNNCDFKNRLIIILNDNEMSISRNVGNLSKHISKVRSTKGYLRFKHGVEKLLGKIPLVGKPLADLARKIKMKFKGTVYSLNIFENMGIKYLGPVDGNDYDTVETMLYEAKRRKGTVLIHIKTLKGCGYREAIENPEKYHGISPKDSPKSKNGTFSEYAGKILCELAQNDEKVCAITAAMSAGTGLCQFEKEYPDRLFDVGIAEAHAVTFSAGLSAAGEKPFFAVYSTFLQRAYDNLIHDVDIQKLSGTLLIDRAGLAPEDGITHHGIHDVAFLSQLENVVIFEPLCYDSMREMMRYSKDCKKLCAIRYPKGSEDEDLKKTFFPKEDYDDFAIRTAYVGNDGKTSENVIITYGRIASEAVEAARKLCEEGIKTSIILMQKLCPYDDTAKEIEAVLNKDTCGKIVFAEEGIYNGGASMILQNKLLSDGVLQNKKSKILAITQSPEQGMLSSLYKKCGISSEDIIDAVKNQ